MVERIAPALLALTLAGSASVAAPATNPRRVWVFDGEKDTYFTMRPLRGPNDVVYSVDPIDELSWNKVNAWVHWECPAYEAKDWNGNLTAVEREIVVTGRRQ